MQTVTRRMFLAGACAVAFHILALNSHRELLMVLSASTLTLFLSMALSLLVTRLATRHYNKRRLLTIRNLMDVVAKLLAKYEPKRMPPGCMHEMHPLGEYGIRLEEISRSTDALEARVGSLDEATALHEEIITLLEELMRLRGRALEGLGFSSQS